jgi:hypothetical protein
VLEALARLVIIGYTIIMVASIKKVRASKKARGRPRVGSAKILVAVPPDLLKELDAFRSGLPDKAGRPEAIRHLMTEALSRLSKKGHLKGEARSEAVRQVIERGTEK